jgi:hypothetical protein
MRILSISRLGPFWTVLLFGCIGGPAPEDTIALEKIEALYGDRYKFKLRDYGYLLVEAKDSIDDGEVIEVYRDFVFDEEGNNRGTGVVWLNVYNREGDFLYQLVFDPETDRFIRGNQEFH